MHQNYIYLQETLVNGHRLCCEQHEIPANGEVERNGCFNASLDFLAK